MRGLKYYVVCRNRSLAPEVPFIVARLTAQHLARVLATAVLGAAVGAAGLPEETSPG